MKSLLSFIVVISYFSHSYSQICGYEKPLNQSELCDITSGIFSEEDPYAEIAVEKILSVIGSPINFILVSCDNIDNCVATTYKSTRFIVYDKYFMNDIASKNDWVKISIFAHEVGHHILGHAFDFSLYEKESDLPIQSYDLSKKMELEADEFSGIVLARMGATLEEAQMAINNISDNFDDSKSTHPNKSKRLNAIKLGFNKGLDKTYIIKNLPSDKNEYTCFMEGYKFYRIKKNNQAIIFLKESIEINPYFYMSYLSIGKIYDDTQFNKQAIEYIEKALELNLNIEIAYSLLGNLYYKEKNYDKSYYYFEKAIKLYPKSSMNYLGIGIILEDIGKTRDALDFYKIAYELDPSNPVICSILGGYYYTIEDFKNAVYYFDKAIFYDSNDVSNYFYRGISRYYTSDKISGCNDLIKAYKLGYTEAVKYYNLYCK